MRRQIAIELECDASVVRTVKKRKGVDQWLKARGYEPFDQALPSDIGVLKELLSQFESVNYGTSSSGTLPIPVFQGFSNEAETSR